MAYNGISKYAEVCVNCFKTIKTKKVLAWHLKHFYLFRVWIKCDDCAKKDLTTVE